MTEGKETETTKKTITGRIFGVIGNILLYIVIAIALFAVIVSITAKKDIDGTATIFNTQLRFVQSSSMEKCEETDVSKYKIKSIKVKSCIFIEVMPEDETKKAEWLDKIQIGDVLTFKYVYTKQETITHRVIEKEEKLTGGYIITLEGDNKGDGITLGKQVIDTSDDTSPNYIIGKVKGQSYILGLLVYALKSTVGIICLIIIPCLIVIAFQVIRIVRVASKDKKDKAEKTNKDQLNEIEELKRKLAILEEEKEKEAQQSKESASIKETES